jgi:hypothetical protein
MGLRDREKKLDLGAGVASASSGYRHCQCAGLLRGWEGGSESGVTSSLLRSWS